MRATFVRVVLVCLLFTVTGCPRPVAPPAAAKPRHEARSIHLAPANQVGFDPDGEFAHVDCFLWDSKPVVMVWSHRSRARTAGTGANSQRPTVMQFQGTLAYFGANDSLEQEIAYSGEVDNGTQGTITIDGQELDLASGALILVTRSGGKLRVKQLKRNLADFLLEPEALIESGNTDEEISGFFKDGAPQK